MRLTGWWLKAGGMGGGWRLSVNLLIYTVMCLHLSKKQISPNGVKHAFYCVPFQANRMRSVSAIYLLPIWAVSARKRFLPGHVFSYRYRTTTPNPGLANIQLHSITKVYYCTAVWVKVCKAKFSPNKFLLSIFTKSPGTEDSFQLSPFLWVFTNNPIFM